MDAHSYTPQQPREIPSEFRAARTADEFGEIFVSGGFRTAFLHICDEEEEGAEEEGAAESPDAHIRNAAERLGYEPDADQELYTALTQLQAELSVDDKRHQDFNKEWLIPAIWVTYRYAFPEAVLENHQVHMPTQYRDNTVDSSEGVSPSPKRPPNAQKRGTRTRQGAAKPTQPLATPTPTALRARVDEYLLAILRTHAEYAILLKGVTTFPGSEFARLIAAEEKVAQAAERRYRSEIGPAEDMKTYCDALTKLAEELTRSILETLQQVTRLHQSSKLEQELLLVASNCAGERTALTGEIRGVLRGLHRWGAPVESGVEKAKDEIQAARDRLMSARSEETSAVESVSATEADYTVHNTEVLQAAILRVERTGKPQQIEYFYRPNKQIASLYFCDVGRPDPKGWLSRFEGPSSFTVKREPLGKKATAGRTLKRITRRTDPKPELRILATEQTPHTKTALVSILRRLKRSDIPVITSQ